MHSADYQDDEENFTANDDHEEFQQVEDDHDVDDNDNDGLDDHEFKSEDYVGYESDYS